MVPVVNAEPVPFAVGDVVRLKKPHPCGGYDWTVVRLGADIGVKCQRCGRRVLVPRRDLERRLKQFLARGSDAVAEPAGEETGIGGSPLAETSS